MKSEHNKNETVDKMTLAKMIASRVGVVINDALSFIDSFDLINSKVKPKEVFNTGVITASTY